MVRLGIFIFLFGSIISSCTCQSEDIDELNKLLASSGVQQNVATDFKITGLKLIRDIGISQRLLGGTPYLAKFMQQGNNIFYKPQILLGTGMDYPFTSHFSADNNNQEVNKEAGFIVGNNKQESEEEPFSLNRDKDDKVDATKPILQDQTNEILPEIIPEAPILAPLQMPALPEIEIVKNPHQVVVIEETPAPIEHVIITQRPVEVTDSPVLMPSKLPVIIPKPVPHIPSCMASVNKNSDEITVPCLPSFPSTQYDKFNDLNDIVQRKEFIRPVIPVLLPRIPLNFQFNKPIKTIVPYRENVISTTRFIPSVTVAKFPLDISNRVYSHPAKIVIHRVPKEEEPVKEYKDKLTTFPAYCAHNIALGRVLPNISVNSGRIQATPHPTIQNFPVF